MIIEILKAVYNIKRTHSYSFFITMVHTASNHSISRKQVPFLL